MNEQKYEVWWGGNKEWAEPCYAGATENGGRWVTTVDHKGASRSSLVPSEYVHPIEPKIAPGTPCYWWDGDERPGMPPMAYYKRRVEGCHEVDVGEKWGHKYRWIADHVEPIVTQPEIRWDKLDPDYVAVVVYDTGAVRPTIADSLYGVGGCDELGIVVQIIPRPDGATP